MAVLSSAGAPEASVLAARCRLADDQVGPRLARCVDRLRRLLKANPDHWCAVWAVTEYGVRQGEDLP